MKIRIGVGFAALTLVCLLAISCGPSLKDDMQVICDAGKSGEVVGATSLEGKLAGFKRYLATNVKSDDGKAFVAELLALPPAGQVTKLDAGLKAEGVDAKQCSTLTLLKQLPAPE